jgi:hypothetical protein
MNRESFNRWLTENEACAPAVNWCAEHPELSVPGLVSICHRGDWILWLYRKAGYSPEVLVPVAYRAATRAMVYASDALDRAGIKHDLRGIVIDSELCDARDAARAAGDAAGDAAYAAAYAADAADAAADAAAAAYAAERLICANDCRELLPELKIKGVV